MCLAFGMREAKTSTRNNGDEIYHSVSRGGQPNGALLNTVFVVDS